MLHTKGCLIRQSKVGDRLRPDRGKSNPSLKKISEKKKALKSQVYFDINTLIDLIAPKS